ncbi:MAG TPA: Clp protease N-terminal domain-containing protein [Actinomycetota bacterium]|nr:Clp protease N-terminal domain-containing protein [Actinomycetota bacterium]
MAGFFGRRQGRQEARWFGRLTNEARQGVVDAQEEARRLKHNYLGTEHLLLALLRDRRGTAAQALRHAGISLQDVRNDVKRIIGMGSEAPPGRIPFTPRAKKVFELALRATQTHGESHIRSHHILIGLIEEGEGVAAHILRDRGVTREAIEAALAE